MSQRRELIVPAALDRTALEALAEMTGGDPEFLGELIDTFFADGADLLAAIGAAAASSDAAALRRAAHTLKSNARTFGAVALGEVCQTIEERAAAGELDGVDALIARVQGEYPAVVAALDRERADA
jgi:HPt (histidine-containing phosphotransfer) domain-containing protein